MARFIKKVSKTAHLPPGTPVHVGERREQRVRITCIDYDADRFEERTLEAVEESYPFRDTPGVTWINMDGIHQVDLIEKFGAHFGLHPLVVEDIEAEQVSLILGRHFVLSFQEREGDVWGPLRERIRAAKGRIRQMGPDYLLYSLVDAVVDGYFSVLEKLGERIEELEDGLADEPSTETLRDIHDMKREMIFLRKSVWPLREAISGLERGGSGLIQPETQLFLRDVYDHTIQVMDTIESFRDIAGGMIDTYLSSMSNRMNEVMKVLTMIATLFIPLTFIAGVYGMNFKHMPELDWQWSYPVVLIVMVAVTALMLLYFRRKDWI